MLRQMVIALICAASAPAALADEPNRKDKTAYVAAEVIGFTLMPVQGLRAGYFISPDLTAELALATGGAAVGDFEADKTLVALKAKYFIGDSFYVDGGLAYESWDVQYPVMKSGSTSETTKLEASVVNTGAVIHIGNQWQWSGFTLGVDWAGYFMALSTATEFKGDSSVDAADKKQEEKDVENTMGGSGAHIARLYLGWAF